MKHLIFIIALFITVLSNAQVHGVHAVDYTPMTTVQMNALTSVPEGRTIYNTTTKSPWTYDGSVWSEVGAIGAGAVTSVNGQADVVVLDPDDLDDASTTNKFTNASEKSKLAGIEAGAEQNVQSDYTALSGDAFILNKPTLGDLAAKDLVGVGDILGEGVNGQVPVTNGAGEVTWQTPSSASVDFVDITGSARDNADLDAELDLKADLTDIPDVINNLTSTDTDKALSAAQGKILQDGKGGLTTKNIWTGVSGNHFNTDMSTRYLFLGEQEGVLGKRWWVNTSPATGEDLRFNLQLSDQTGYNSGTFGLYYKLNASGSPVDPEDLIDLAYFEANSGGDQTAAEVPVTASGFDGNLDTGDDTVQKVAQKLDDLVVDIGGGIVAEGVLTTSGGVSVHTISHGLGYAPANTRIQLQALYTAGSSVELEVQNITSTTFDIDLDVTVNGYIVAWRIFGVGSETPLDFGEIATGLDTEIGDTDWRTGGDTVDATSVNAAGAVMNSDTSTASMSFVVDEDTMTSNSATKVPTQQSVKAYIDANSGSGIPVHAESGVAITSIGAGTEAEKAAATILSTDIWFPTDAPPATTFTGTVIPLDGYYTIDNTSTDTAIWTLNATVRNGAAFDILIDMASEPTITGATEIPGTAGFETNTLSVIKGSVIQGTVYYYFLSLE